MSVTEYGVHFWSRALGAHTVWRCLNLEAATPEMMEKKRDEVLEVIRG